MKNYFIKPTCLLVILFSVTTKGISQSNDELKAKIEKINKEMATAMKERNTEKSLSFYTQDAIYMPNYGKMVEGKEAIKKANEEMMSSGSKVISFETTPLKVTGNGKMVTEIGTYKISMTMGDNQQPVEDSGKYLTIWEKQSDGSLKIKTEIWNADSYPMAMGNKQ